MSLWWVCGHRRRTLIGVLTGGADPQPVTTDALRPDGAGGKAGSAKAPRKKTKAAHGLAPAWPPALRARHVSAELKPHLCAPGGITFDVDRPAVEANDGAHDSQPKSAARTGSPHRVRPEKPAEDMG